MPVQNGGLGRDKPHQFHKPQNLQKNCTNRAQSCGAVWDVVQDIYYSSRIVHKATKYPKFIFPTSVKFLPAPSRNTVKKFGPRIPWCLRGGRVLFHLPICIFSWVSPLLHKEFRLQCPGKKHVCLYWGKLRLCASENLERPKRNMHRPRLFFTRSYWCDRSQMNKASRSLGRQNFTTKPTKIVLEDNENISKKKLRCQLLIPSNLVRTLFLSAKPAEKISRLHCGFWSYRGSDADGPSGTCFRYTWNLRFAWFEWTFSCAIIFSVLHSPSATSLEMKIRTKNCGQPSRQEICLPRIHKFMRNERRLVTKFLADIYIPKFVAGSTLATLQGKIGFQLS